MMSDERRSRLPQGRQWLRWGGTILSLVLFIWLVARQDWKAAWENISSLPPWVILLALALFFLRALLNGVRWQVLLRTAKIHIPLQETEKIVFLGMFVSNFLPTTIGGDTVRFLSLLRYTSQRALGFASVVLDRFVNVAAMFTVIPFTLWTYGSSVLDFLGIANRAGSPLVVIGAIYRGNRLHRYYHQFRDLVSYWSGVFQVWFRQPSSLLLAFVISWLTIFTYFLALWILAKGLGMQIELYQIMGTTAITYLITLLPISINGYGVREVAIATLYVHLGADIEQASALAIISRALMLITTLPGALWISPILAGDLDESVMDAEKDAVGSSQSFS